MILDSASNLFMTVILRALQLIQNLLETLTRRTNNRTFLEKTGRVGCLSPDAHISNELPTVCSMSG